MPRAGLTCQKVVHEAALVADEAGWERLSLASVARRLEVRLPSLYKHIDSLEALRGGVAALATRELADELTGAAVGRSGSHALRAIADAYRSYAQRCPGRYAATIRAPDADNTAHVEAAEAAIRVIYATLAGYGLEGSDAVDAARALRASLHGFVTLEAHGGFGLPEDVDRSYRRLVGGLDAMLSSLSSLDER
ncbi:MAG: TetR/AcrR family transcriptional regulator [Nocardioidaceae bacterium]